MQISKFHFELHLYDRCSTYRYRYNMPRYPEKRRFPLHIFLDYFAGEKTFKKMKMCSRDGYTPQIGDSVSSKGINIICYSGGEISHVVKSIYIE